jgi:hypothetical protein
MEDKFKEIVVRVGSYRPNVDYRRSKKFKGIKLVTINTNENARGRDDRGVDYTLYERPENKGYFVLSESWSKWDGESNVDELHTIATDQELVNYYPALANAAGIDTPEDLD